LDSVTIPTHREPCFLCSHEGTLLRSHMYIRDDIRACRMSQWIVERSTRSSRWGPVFQPYAYSHVAGDRCHPIESAVCPALVSVRFASTLLRASLISRLLPSIVCRTGAGLAG
jgi:hypothetical protein